MLKENPLKTVAMEQYLEEVKGSGVGNFPIAYKFKDVETGETFSSGDLEVPAAYKRI